jgi:hypothetical protein
VHGKTSREGLAAAEKTITNFVERLTRLYEQSHNALCALRLGEYVRRWVGWLRGGINAKTPPRLIDLEALLALQKKRRPGIVRGVSFRADCSCVFTQSGAAGSV